MDVIRASDAGFTYRPEPPERSEDRPRSDAGARPSLALFAGTPSGRGDVDGVGADARIGKVGGMVRVGDAIVFADEGNGSVRRVTIASGEVTTLARLPTDGVPSLPYGIAYDGRGRVFVADRSHHVIYSLDLGSRALAPVVGRPGVRGDRDGALADALLDTPSGLALAGRTLYVTDTANRRVRRVDLAAGTIASLPPTLKRPQGICFDDGVLYVSDTLAEALFRIDPISGASTVLAGSNRYGYAGPIDGVAGGARFREPRGLWCAKDALYVADRGNNQLRKVDKGAWRVTTLAGRASTRDFRDGPADFAYFLDPQSVLEDDGALFVGDDAALRVVQGGQVRTVAGTGYRTTLGVDEIERGGMLQPTGIAIAEGGLFVSECGAPTVRRIDLATRKTTTFAGASWARGFTDAVAGDARLGCVASIVADHRGTLFFGDRTNHAIRALRIATRRVETVAGSYSRCGNDDGGLDGATFCDPAALAFDDLGGHLYVADRSASTIRNVDLGRGVVSTLAGAPFERGHADGRGRAARFDSPSALVLQRGVLFVADHENDLLRRIDVRTGEVTTTGGKASFDGIEALAALDDGTLLAFDRASVRRVDAERGEVTTLLRSAAATHRGAPSLTQPVAAIQAAPGTALVVDRAEGVILELDY
jgi:sugar lactone lactonase YvrE